MYLSAKEKGTPQEIENAKYKLLWEASNLLEIIANYIALEKSGISFDFGKSIIQKGTKLYRIRMYEENTDFSNKIQWEPAPHRPQNRANRTGQEALYVGSTESICLLETHIAYRQKYVLGVYECVEDIEVGGFLNFSPQNRLHNMAGIILNAFLIAPSRSKKNQELFSYLDSVYDVKLNDFENLYFVDSSEEFELPFRFGVLNQRNQYYKLTNQLCEMVMKHTPCGIRYSSCYLPMESPGIECSDYNLVLYHEGIEKLSFLDYQVKTFNKNISTIDIVKCIRRSIDDKSNTEI